MLLLAKVETLNASYELTHKELNSYDEYSNQSEAETVD